MDIMILGNKCVWNGSRSGAELKVHNTIIVEGLQDRVRAVDDTGSITAKGIDVP